MNCSTWRALSFVVSLLCAGSGYAPLAAVELPSRTPLDAQAWADSVKSTLSVPSDAELDALRQTTLQRLDEVFAALENVPDGAWTRRVCELDALREQLQQKMPDPRALEAAYFCLRHDYGREIQAPISALRQSVDKLRGWTALRTSGLNEQELTGHVDVIIGRLNHPEITLSGEQANELRYAYAWLAQWRRVDDQLAKLTGQLSQPNQVMKLSASYMESLASRRIVHPVTINESQDDAQISGRGNIEVLPAVELRPNNERGEVLIHVDGSGRVPLVAVTKPATIYANSRISFAGNQTVFLTPTGVESTNASISANSRTSLCSVQLNMRSRIARRLLQRIVQRVASRKLSESDVQAAQRAQQQIQTEVVENSLLFATQLNDMMDRFFFRTLGTRDVEPHVRVRSSADELTWSAEYAARWQLGALTPPPAPSEPVGVLLQFHESAFNNASAAIGGVRLNEPAFQEVLFGLFRLQPPDDSWQMGGRIPAVLHLSDRDPLEVRFDEGRIRAKLNIQGFEFGGQHIEGQYFIEATYEPQSSEVGISMDRIGDTTIGPTNGSESELLKSAAARFFIPKAIALPKPKPSSTGSLKINHLRLEDGWLSFGLTTAPSTENR